MSRGDRNHGILDIFWSAKLVLVTKATFGHQFGHQTSVFGHQLGHQNGLVNNLLTKIDLLGKIVWSAKMHKVFIVFSMISFTFGLCVP